MPSRIILIRKIPGRDLGYVSTICTLHQVVLSQRKSPYGRGPLDVTDAGLFSWFLSLRSRARTLMLVTFISTYLCVMVAARICWYIYEVHDA